MNINPFNCTCGATPVVDDVNPDAPYVVCPVCGSSLEGPNVFAAVCGWNLMVGKRISDIKNLEPSEDE